MPTNVRVATAQASFREGTEDRLVVVHLDDGSLVVVVADGVGGISGGGPAADLAVRSVEHAVRSGELDSKHGDAWVRLLRELDMKVEADPEAGETTLVVVAITDDGIVGVGCGDSGALLISQREVDDLSKGQHRRLRVGCGRAVPIAFTRPWLEAGSTLITASDGLLAYCPQPKLAEILRAYDDDLDMAAQALVQAVTPRSGELIDDVAVVLVAAK